MSAVVPGCDSDEEVFWGPVTARELEIIWRSRMVNKNKGESDNPIEKLTKNSEEPNVSSVQNICSISSSNSVQEVPRLQDLPDSSGNQKILLQGNDNQDHLENSEHEAVGNESMLPLLEATMVINQAQEGNQNVSNAIHVHSNEEHVNCEPESSNQLNNSIKNPESNENNLVHTMDNEENINCTVDDLNKILHETTESQQPNDIRLSAIEASKECCVNTSNETTASGSVNAIMPQSDNTVSINLISSDNQFETSNFKINASLNQSNIENIPPEELNNDVVVLNVVDNIKKTGPCDPRLNCCNVLQELEIVNHDESINDDHVLHIDKTDKTDNASANGGSESSDEKSYVSFNIEEDNSSNSQYSSSNQECPEALVKNKENEEPLSEQTNDGVKSKIPVLNHIKSTFIKPAKLQHTPGTINHKWLNDLKRKKIPKPKKPDYMLSPAKLESIMKSSNQPMSRDDPNAKRLTQPKTVSTSQKPIPGSLRTLVTPRKKQFEHVKSPISQYIKTGTGIPTAKSLPALQSPNRIPVLSSVKHTPVQKLPPKFYSSAEKLVIKPGSSSSVLKPTENRLFLTPKIFKHQGRVADSKKPGDINVVTPRAVRKTNLTETSFACLPQSSKKLDISVLEEV